MKRFRDLAFVAAIAGLAAYQGRQLTIYAASGQAPATTQNAGPTHGGNAGSAASPGMASGTKGKTVGRDALRKVSSLAGTFISMKFGPHRSRCLRSTNAPSDRTRMTCETP